MIFPYRALATKAPIATLAGAMVRYRPVFTLGVAGPLGARLIDACVDCGADDTIFPVSVARKLGIDLTGAPQGEARPIGGAIVRYFYAGVTLRMSDGLEMCEWNATVGFVNLPLRWALLGHAGFLNYFDTDLRGARREVCLTPNGGFAGTHLRGTVHSPMRQMAIEFLEIQHTLSLPMGGKRTSAIDRQTV